MTASATMPIGMLMKKIQMPRAVLGEQAAEERAEDGRDAEHGPEQALVLAALPGFEQVADDGEADGEQRSGAESLDAPEDDQLGHVLAQARQRRADQEDRDADHQHRLAAVQVGQLAVERHRDRGGEQVDRDRPGQQRLAAEVRDDRGQRDRDDRLVQRAQEQAEQDGEQDLHLRPVGEVEGTEAVGGGRVVLHGHGFQVGSFRQAPARPGSGRGQGCGRAGPGGAARVRAGCEVRVALGRRRELGLDGDPQVRGGDREPVELLDVHALEGGGDDGALDELGLVHEIEAGLRGLHEDDPPIVGDPHALDEPALLHAIDDARGARHRDVQDLRQAAHGHGVVVAEQRQHVEMGHADAEPNQALRAGAPERADGAPEAGDGVLGCRAAVGAPRCRTSMVRIE